VVSGCQPDHARDCAQQADDGSQQRALDQCEKRAREKRERAGSLDLNDKRFDAWFDQFDRGAVAALEAIIAEREPTSSLPRLR